MIIFLAESVRHAMVGIANDYFPLTKLNRAELTGLWGDEHFKIVTKSEQLRGLRFTKYVVLGRPDRDLVAMAHEMATRFAQVAK